MVEKQGLEPKLLHGQEQGQGQGQGQGLDLELVLTLKLAPVPVVKRLPQLELEL